MNPDFYELFSNLEPEDVAFWKRFRSFLLANVSPIIDDHWNRGVFPQEVRGPFGAFLQEEFGDKEYVYPPPNPVPFRLMKLELGRIDPSMASFFAVHWGLAMGSISMFGSPEQKSKWLPGMVCMDQIGSWALTEPLSGSDAAFGLRTTATKTEKGWILSGEKKWSGNASMADVIVVWAKEDNGDRILGFLLEPNMEGVHIEKITDKIAKRAMENVNISLDRVVVSEASRLPHVENFKQIGHPTFGWPDCRVLGSFGGLPWACMKLLFLMHKSANSLANPYQAFSSFKRSLSICWKRSHLCNPCSFSSTTSKQKMDLFEAHRLLLQKEHVVVGRGRCVRSGAIFWGGMGFYSPLASPAFLQIWKRCLVMKALMR